MNGLLRATLVLGLLVLGYGVFRALNPVQTSAPQSTVRLPVTEPAVSTGTNPVTVAVSTPATPAPAAAAEPPAQTHPASAKPAPHPKKHPPAPKKPAAKPVHAASTAAGGPDQFNPIILKTINKPVPVPPDIQLPSVVAEESEWGASQCGIQAAAKMVFRNETTWRTFWSQAIAPYTPALKEIPAVDFRSEMVVGVFMGNKPVAGYQTRIESTTVDVTGPQERMVVRYMNSEPAPENAGAKFTVQPFYLRKVTSTSAKIQFYRTTNQ